MFDSPILDVIISLVFVFFLMSILVSGIVEIIANFFEFRGKDLRWAIDEVFNDPNNKNWTELMYEHPLIDGLKKTDDNVPSHISAELFTKALVDVMIHEGREVAFHTDESGVIHLSETYPFDQFLLELMTSEENLGNEGGEIGQEGDDAGRTGNRRAAFGAAQLKRMQAAPADEINRMEVERKRKELLEDAHTLIDSPSEYKLKLEGTELTIDNSFGTFYNFRAGVNKMKTGDVKTLLNNFIHKSKNYEELKNHLESWYREYMGQTTEWYKKKIRKWLFCTGLLAALVLNVDSIKLAHTLYINKDLRDLIVAQAMVASRDSYPVARDKIVNPAGAGQKVAKDTATQKTAARNSTPAQAGGKPPAAPAASPAPAAAEPTGEEPATGDDIVDEGEGLPEQQTAQQEKPAPPQPAAPAAATATVTYADSVKDQWEGIIAAYKSLDALNLPIGWNSSPDPPESECATGLMDRLRYEILKVRNDIRFSLQGNLFMMILGWIFTAIAVSLGAPFWFEVMKKLISVRRESPVKNNS